MGTTHQSIGECEPEASDEEFTIAFQLAIEIGQLGPLRKHHQAGKPIPGDVGPCSCARCWMPITSARRRHPCDRSVP